MKWTRDAAPSREGRRLAYDGMGGEAVIFGAERTAPTARAAGLDEGETGTIRTDQWSLTRVGDELRLSIRGPIDDWWGVDVYRVTRALERAGPADRIMLDITTPGGFADEGLLLYHQLRIRADAGAEIRARATGLVASAGIAIWLAADVREMPPGSVLMTHECACGILAFRTAREMRALVERVAGGAEAIDGTYRDIAVARTGLTDDAVAELDRAETWMRPDQALELGYATAGEAGGGGSEGADGGEGAARLQRSMTEVMARGGF